MVWPYPGAGLLGVLRGALQGKDWCWSGTDCKGRSVPSGSAEQRARAFITVTGGGGGGGDRGVTGPVRPISGLAADAVPPGAMHVLLEAAARVTGKEEADR